MGSTYDFKCSKCAYTVHASGGNDRGFHRYCRTIKCNNCNSVHDIDIKNKEVGYLEQKCRNCDSGDISDWDLNCPICTNKMTKDLFSRFMWD